MQFNVTNGPVSTWKRYRHAFRDGRRPRGYPHRTRSHPSIYDDFDAIMAAGLLLSRSGAGPSLDGACWSAAYSYYGHDLFGITVRQPGPGARGGVAATRLLSQLRPGRWLVVEFDRAYGAAARRQLTGADHKKHKKKHKPRSTRSTRSTRSGAKRRTGGTARSARATRARQPTPLGDAPHAEAEARALAATRTAAKGKSRPRRPLRPLRPRRRRLRRQRRRSASARPSRSCWGASPHRCRMDAYGRSWPFDSHARGWPSAVPKASRLRRPAPCPTSRGTLPR